jgi:hypothetical protein
VKYQSLQAAEDMYRGVKKGCAFRDSAQRELQIPQTRIAASPLFLIFYSLYTILNYVVSST